MELLSIALALHGMAVALVWYDLLAKSRRHNKGGWAAFVLILPLFGILIYNQTKQRHSTSRWF